MYKQKMYDEGVSLVNKQLDAFQSIRDSLTKEQDRKYFDQEATKLVNALNKNASLDLSVKSNLQSVLQSGNQLVRDPYIKQAAESSSTLKKMMEEQSKLDPSKRSAVNDYFFNKDMQSWLNDGKVGSKLNYNPYTIYTDEHKKLWSEIVDKMKPDTTESLVFNGARGEWITKTTYSGKSAEKLRGAYMAGLSAQGQNQLRMEAQYQLETGDKNALTQDYIKYNQLVAQDLGTKIASKEEDKGTAAKKYGESSPEVLALTNEIKELKMQQSVYEENASKTPDQLTDPDLTGHLINQKIIDPSNDWAYEQIKRDVTANPYVVDQQKMINNIREHEEKIKINARYGLDAVGKVTNGGMPLGYAEMPASQLSSTESLITNNKLLANIATNLAGTFENNPSLLAGINAFISNGPGQNLKTVKEVLKRAMVAPTWAPQDRKKIMYEMSGSPELYKLMAQNPGMKGELIKVSDKNMELAKTWFNTLKKIGSSVFDVYDLQAGGYASRDQGKITDILLNNEQVDIKNVNTQGNRASAIKAEIPNASDAETFNPDGTGLTFVPKKPKSEMVIYVARDRAGKNIQKTITLNDFLESPASDLINMEDIRIVPATK
jgi:predicted glutamine amidotransferase/lambda repressor-like predicted transcriptional regulator